MMRSQLLAAVPCGPRLADQCLSAINRACEEFDINTPARQAAFIAQCAHESACFALMKEVWGPTDWQIKYEGHTGLGNTQPGDGKKFLGRGPIGTTGRHNYTAASLALFGDLRLLDKPELLEQPEHGFRASGYFWKSHGLNELADVGNFQRITKIINPGMLHYDRRLKLYQRALPAFGGVVA
jgi:putative chitinase